MKKLAYIILVIAILLIIGIFVKNDTSANSNDVTVAAEENIPSTQTEATSQPNTPNEDSDVVEVHERAEDIIIGEDAPEGEDAIDVEETSEATMDEEETILPE